MIRFVSLTEVTGWPSCAFLSTVTDQFIQRQGSHVFCCMGEVPAHLQALVPAGHFDRKTVVPE